MATTSAANSSIALSGLASGIDWTSIVNELLTVERAPETQMQAQQTTDNNKNTAYQALGTSLTSLASDVSSLGDPTFFDNRTTNVSNPSVASATAAAGTALGNYTFNVTQIATDASQLGSTGIANSLSPTSNVSALTLSSAGFAQPVTAGTFTVNGQAVTIATSDTLQSVFDKISTATGGAVTGSYNPTTDEISLNSSNPIVLGSSADTSNFLQTAQLYNNGTGIINSAAALGAINLVGSLSSANFKTAINAGSSSPNGSFEINGVTINYDTTTDAVADVLNRINNSAAGVTATYDAVNGRFQLTSKTTGDVGISMQDTNGGNFLAATGLSTGTLQRGANLQYSINGGGTLTAQSNLITGTSSGITGLSVTASSLGTSTVTVASDTSKISTTINQFVTDYNAVQNLIGTDIKPTTDSSGNLTPALLTGDFDTEGIGTQLRQLANAAPGLSSTIQTLTDLGIDSNGTDNTLSVDNPALLNSALANNLDTVKQLFTDPTSGIATQLNNYLGSATSATGLLSQQGSLAKDESEMTNESQNITTSINNLNQRISQDQTRLTNEFVAMETAISSINSEKQYLNAFLSSSASSNAAPQAAGSNISSSSSSSSSTA